MDIPINTYAVRDGCFRLLLDVNAIACYGCAVLIFKALKGQYFCQDDGNPSQCRYIFNKMPFAKKAVMSRP